MSLKGCFPRSISDQSPFDRVIIAVSRWAQNAARMVRNFMRKQSRDSIALFLTAALAAATVLLADAEPDLFFSVMLARW